MRQDEPGIGEAAVGGARFERAVAAQQALEIAPVRAELGERRVDELNEARWRLAMEAETALGLQEAANQGYNQLRALLDEQLGLELEKATRALYHQLLSQGDSRDGVSVDGYVCSGGGGAAT